MCGPVSGAESVRESHTREEWIQRGEDQRASSFSGFARIGALSGGRCANSLFWALVSREGSFRSHSRDEGAARNPASNCGGGAAKGGARGAREAIATRQCRISGACRWRQASDHHFFFAHHGTSIARLRNTRKKHS